MVLTASAQQAMMLASQLLQRGDAAGAERTLTPHMSNLAQADPQLLNLGGLIRLQQQRTQEAAALFTHARDRDPRQAQYEFHLGRARAALGEETEAIAAYRAAIKLKSDLAEAYLELAALQQRSGRLEDAEATCRNLLRKMPGNDRAKLALGMVMMQLGRPAEAEVLLRRALSGKPEAGMQAALRNGFAWSLRRQNKHIEALAEFEAAKRLDPTLPFVDIQRAEILQDLKRYDEAIAIFREGLAREPLNYQLHDFYNNLLYRLNATDDYLKSYDRAPQSRELLLGKAWFLSREKRAEEAHALYAQVLARDPADPVALNGVAATLAQAGRHDAAATAFDALLAGRGNDPDICNNAAEVALMCRDPQKALGLYQRSLQLSPHNQASLAGISVALRMMGDERDELLNGYDTLIQVFDLEPPEGFSGMAEFNAELNDYLDRLHPGTREYLSQSLRGGTQTPARMFGAGHDLVDRLQVRIDEAVGRYIAELKQDDTHPFLSRRARGFRHTGSWSSRLNDCGFHVNHMHPMGWISSCYYVAVPQAAKNETARQGWIKFGEPSFDVDLANPIRRAIQPVAGRLVLFPSYMWHGTVPFHDAQARTTIAFDAVPTGG
jgi:tetratricopeptide (TPR) repeat protein